MAKASDNQFPKLLLVEGAAPASPAAGNQGLFIDSADHKLKRVNSAGTVTVIEAAGTGGGAASLVRAVLASDFTTTATGTTVDVLTTTFTPPVSGVLTVVSRIRLANTGSSDLYSVFSITPTVPSESVTDVISAVSPSQPGNVYTTQRLVGAFQLAGGVTYTLKLRLLKGSSGTATVSSGSGDTAINATFQPS